MAHSPPQSAERLARGGGLGRGVIDPERAQGVHDRARTEKVLDREAQIPRRTDLARRDDGDARAGAAPLLLVERPARDSRGIAQAAEHDGGAGLGRRKGNGRSVDRDGACGRVQCDLFASLDGIRHGRREPKDVDDHDDVCRREAGEAREAPLEAELVAMLVERMGHPTSLRRPPRVRAAVRHWSMRILLKLEIDCDPDAAWRALHSPRAVAELYGPFVDLEPLAAMPTSWRPGDDVPVQLSALGIVPIGRQLIHMSERFVAEPAGRVRIFRDSGIPLTGPLASLDVWDHQMAISPVPGHPDRTLWRDRLVVGGPTALALWPLLWSIWQWRAARIRRLAPTWAHDPEVDADPDSARVG